MRLEPSVAVSILAGGQSSRMGAHRNKAVLRLGGRTLLARIRGAVEPTGWRVRVIRRDLVPRCGPLGGVHAALSTTKAAAEMFLACDMPFVTPALLTKLARCLNRSRRAVFTVSSGTVGFPFGIWADALPVIQRQIRARRFSLQRLAEALQARLVPVPPAARHQLLNINTPQDWAEARLRFRAQRRPKGSRRPKNPGGRPL